MLSAFFLAAGVFDIKYKLKPHNSNQLSIVARCFIDNNILIFASEFQIDLRLLMRI